MKRRRSISELNAEMDRIKKRKPTNEQIQELAALFRRLYTNDRCNHLKLLHGEKCVKLDSYPENERK